MLTKLQTYSSGWEHFWAWLLRTTRLKMHRKDHLRLQRTTHHLCGDQGCSQNTEGSFTVEAYDHRIGLVPLDGASFVSDDYRVFVVLHKRREKKGWHWCYNSSWTAMTAGRRSRVLLEESMMACSSDKDHERHCLVWLLPLWADLR